MCAAGSKWRRPGRQRGMTLLELLVVLVIAALMLALVAPNIGRVLPGSELKSFARQSAALLRELRSEAVSQSRISLLELDEEGRVYRSGAEQRLRWPDQIGVSLQPGQLPTLLAGHLVNRRALIFFPDGSSNGGTLKLAVEDAGSFLIEVDAMSGRVSIGG